MKFFKDEPMIKWTKVLCPFCGGPSGSASECYRNPPTKNIPKLIGNNGLPLPIYSTNCTFRADNIWECDINYPVSEILLERISEIRGVDRVFATKTYTFQIIIAKSFAELNIKREVNGTFNTFIKEMQAREANRIPQKLDKKYQGIRFPNGESYIVDSKEDNDDVISFLLGEFPGTSGIPSES